MIKILGPDDEEWGNKWVSDPNLLPPNGLIVLIQLKEKFVYKASYYLAYWVERDNEILWLDDTPWRKFPHNSVKAWQYIKPYKADEQESEE